MEILAAYDLTGSFRAAGELTGCSHHTVAAHVRARDEGMPPPTYKPRPKVTDEFLPKIEEWVEPSKGKIRADKAYKRLKSLGFKGSGRATRRAVALVAPKTQITTPEFEALMDELKMPHAKMIAADLLATAKAQHWEPAEAARALLPEEVPGRAAALLALRRKAAKFPTGKTFDAWDHQASSIDLPRQQSLRTLEWIERKENLVLAGPSGTGKTFFL